MFSSTPLIFWILGAILVFSSAGILLVKKPVHACLCFLLTLLTLATTYLQLSAEFIGVMQILVYAGAILVIFMFVIVLFQDAHEKIGNDQAQSQAYFLWFTSALLVGALLYLIFHFTGMQAAPEHVTSQFGTVQQLGHALYVDFFFPFEAVILIFLAAIVGALYIGRREET